MIKYLRKLTREDMERACIPPEYWGATLSRVPEPARTVITNYLDEGKDFIKNGTGLHFVGPTGVGKTSAACVVAKVCRSRGIPVYMVTPFELREAQKNKINFEDDVSVVTRCRSVGLLVLDGWDEVDMKDYYIGAKFVADLLRHRKSHLLPTLVTTRVQFDDGDLIAAAEGCLVPVDVDGPNQRQANIDKTTQALYQGT